LFLVVGLLGLSSVSGTSGKIGEFSCQMDLNLGQPTHSSAKSQSEGTIQLVPELQKMAIIIA